MIITPLEMHFYQHCNVSHPYLVKLFPLQRKFDGKNPECVIDALIMQQATLRALNDGKEVLSNQDLVNLMQALVSAG